MGKNSPSCHVAPARHRPSRLANMTSDLYSVPGMCQGGGLVGAEPPQRGRSYTTRQRPVKPCHPVERLCGHPYHVSQPDLGLVSELFMGSHLPCSCSSTLLKCEWKKRKSKRTSRARAFYFLSRREFMLINFHSYSTPGNVFTFIFYILYSWITAVKYD